MHFWKYQALGNDYLVVEEAASRELLDSARIQKVCDRHFGVGSDGILVHRASESASESESESESRSSQSFLLQILNPDGSEAEKSGNGLRIFARYLYDRGLVAEAPFEVETAGGRVSCQVLEGGRSARVDMGAACFDSERIPVAGPPREVLREPIELRCHTFEYSAVSMGNPHCVVFRDRVCEAETRELGPLLETDARFPNRSNVQFARVLDRGRLRIEIWERGAGYTLASGSSASAAAAVAHRLGYCDAKIRVQMPGGDLEVEIGTGYEVRIEGPVGAVATGEISPELLQAPAR